MNQRLALLFLVLALSFNGWGKVLIRGKIQGYDGKSKVTYQATIEGIFTPYWQTLQPAANGTFRIEFENEGFGNVQVWYRRIGYRFFHDANSNIYFEIKQMSDPKDDAVKKQIPGDKIFLVIDSVKQLALVKISGDYEAINRFYNKNLRSSYYSTRSVDGNYYSDLILKAKTPTAALEILDSLTCIETEQINRLPWNANVEKPDLQKKDEEIREFLTNEVHAFYGAVFLNGMFRKRARHVTKIMMDSTAKPNLYNREWELLIEKLAEQTKQNLKATPGSADYMDFMESLSYTLSAYRQYNFPQTLTVPLDKMVVDALFNYDTTLFRDKKSRFAHELSILQLYLNDQMFFSPTLLHAVYDLEAKYPGSANLEFYKPRIEKLKASLEVAQKSFEKGEIIETNFNSFTNLLKRFEGKNVLIDVWATWCHPCVEEFKYKSSLTPFVEKNQIEILYISIDKPEWEDRWRQSIKINQLEGKHFRADTKFIKDMWKVIGDYEGAIPRYVLVDGHGKIFKSTAARPGDGDELLHQIESLIKSGEQSK